MNTARKTKVFYWGLWFLPGLLMSFFHVFGPIHEFGHILAAALTDAEVVNVGWNEVSIKGPGWAVVYSGYLFELAFFLILTLILRLRHPGFSFLAWGSCHGCFLMAILGSDFGLTSGLTRTTITVSLLLWTGIFFIIIGFVWPQMGSMLMIHFQKGLDFRAYENQNSTKKCIGNLEKNRRY